MLRNSGKGNAHDLRLISQHNVGRLFLQTVIQRVCGYRAPRLNLNLVSPVNGNQGCGVQLTEDHNSFGPGFNSIGGGW